GGEIVLGAAPGLRVEERARGPGGEGQLAGGAPADALGRAVAPDIGGEDCLVPLVDRIAHGLADEVARDRGAGEPVIAEERPFVLDVFLVARGGVDIEVVAPAGEFDAVIAHLLDERCELFQGKVGPLAGEQGDGTRHGERSEGDWFHSADGDRQGERFGGTGWQSAWRGRGRVARASRRVPPVETNRTADRSSFMRRMPTPSSLRAPASGGQASRREHHSLAL